MISPGTKIGPYRLVQKLGEGGMGEVFEALHEAIERQVAIKVLHPVYAHSSEINKRFINEARAVNLINHPGLVQISDFGTLPSGSSYIVMEFLRGETLAQRLKKRGGPLEPAAVLHTSWQVASALVAAHERGIAHRDLKPENIMLVADALSPTGERAKVLDFGIAKFDLDGTGSHTLAADGGGTAASGRIIGTPTYMSPEQCRGGEVVGPKSDVYSFGVMLYQLLAGHPPFSAVRVPRLLSMHLTEEPPRLDRAVPLLPADLVEFVHRMLLKDPAQRPTMREVVAELERMQAQRGSASAQSLAPPAPARRPEGIEEPDKREEPHAVAPRSARPVADRWERPYSDGRTEGAGVPGQGVISAYDHTLSSGPLPLPLPRIAQHEAGTHVVSSGPHHAPPRVSQSEAGTQVNSGPHYVPRGGAPEPASTLVRSPPSSSSSSSSTLASNAAQSSGLHTAPGTGERTPVPPRPHGRWSLFLASLLGGLTVAAVSWALRPAPPGTAPPEPRPKALSISAPPADAPLRTQPPPAPWIPAQAALSAPPPASTLTGPAAPPVSLNHAPESAPDLRKRSEPLARGARDPSPKRPKGPARPAVLSKKSGSDAAPGVARPEPPLVSRPPDAPAKPHFKIID